MADTLDDFTVSGEDIAQQPDPSPGVDSAASNRGAESGSSDDADDPGVLSDDDASEAGRTLANKRKSYKQVILEKTVNEKAAQRERDDAKAEAARLKAELAGKAAPETPKVEAPAYLTRPKPNSEEIGTKYADWEAYNEDLIEWRIDERDAKKAQESRATATEQNERAIVAKVQERIAAFKADHDDYDTVVNSASIPEGSPGYLAIMHHLRYSELGPHLAYELGKDQNTLTRIANLAPGFAVAALGKLEGQIEARETAAKSGTAAPAKTVTNAKPPIKPVGSSPVTSDDGDADDLSPAAVDKHIARENARERDFRIAGRRG